jgi:hypothetical protein
MIYPMLLANKANRHTVFLGIIAATFSASVWYTIFEDCERQVQKQKAFTSGIASAVTFTPMPPTPPNPVLVPIIENDQVQPYVEMK